MRVGVLGPLLVLDQDGTEVLIPAAKVRAVLTVLALQAGSTVGAAELMEAIWGEYPPRSAAKTLQTYVSALRRVLPRGVVETVAPGYRLLLPAEAVDVTEFEARLRAGSGALVNDDPAQAVATLTRGLGLWRGEALPDLADQPWGIAAAVRLAELRRSAEELLVDARLALGEHAELVGDLETAVAAEPLRERRWAQLMTALYRSGRQADALRAYQRLRKILAEQLGIEPSAQLQDLERAVLSQDPALAGDSPASTSPTAPKALPSGVVTFMLTDIVGSTRLWSADPEAMATALSRHDEIVRTAVESHSGLVVKPRGEGDSTFNVFTRASDAAAAALDSQKALGREPWPEACPIAVRIAIHTGEALERDGDYLGTTVNRAARLRAVAAGGEILLSGATGELVRDRLPRDARLVETGYRRLRDFDRPEPVFVLQAAGPDGHYAQARPLGLGGTEEARDQELPTKADDPAASTSEIAVVIERHHRGSRARIAATVVVGCVALVIAAVFLGLRNRSNPAKFPAALPATSASYTPSFVPVTCPPGTGGAGVSCGDLLVPQDRAHPTGLQVRLLVVRAQSQAALAAPEPVVDLGGSGNKPYEGAASTTRLYADYIELTLRGTPGSVPELACPEVNSAAESALALPGLSARAVSEQVTAMAACRTRLVASGVDPNDYGNDAAAADFRDLLRLLHIGRANLLVDWSRSFLAYDIMRRYPQLVRSTMIEDPVPTGQSPDVVAVSGLNDALERYVALCRASPSCRDAFPDIRGQLSRDVAQFQQHPVTVSVPVGPGHTPTPVFIDGDRLVQVVAEVMTNSLGYAELAAAIYGPPDPAVIGNLAPDYWIGEGNGPSGWWASFYCKDQLPGVSTYVRTYEQAAMQTYPQLTGTDLTARIAEGVCSVWNVQPDDSSDFTPIVSAIPTFLYAGALAPAAEASWITQVAQSLVHPVVVSFPTLGLFVDEDSAAPPCIASLRLDFLRDPEHQPDVAGCEAHSPPIHFAGS